MPKYIRIPVNEDGSINVAVVSGNVTLEATDIEIGAVEIKDSSTDTRATVGANGLHVDVRDMPALDRTADAVAAALQTDAIMNGLTALVPKFAPIVASTSGDTQVVADVSTKKIRVLAGQFTGNGAVNVKFRSNTTDKTGLTYIGAAGQGSIIPFVPVGNFETNAGEALNINLSGNVAVGGWIVYVEV